MSAAVASQKQKILCRNLYRNLQRWCKSVPPDATLGHLGHWVDGIHIDSPQTLEGVLQQSFRYGKSNNIKSDHMKEGIQEAMDGLRILYNINVDDLPKKPTTVIPSSSKLDQASPLLPQNWSDEIEWLPPIPECEDGMVDDSHLPLFPLSGPILLQNSDDDEAIEDPATNSVMFSHLPDVPVEGMEILLRIFEPRYRQLYQDVLAQSGSRRSFVVPFAHPSKPDQFATMGWLYEIVRVEDIADQTNGQVALLCHHLVTKPVKIQRIVNPTDWSTKFTYLRVQAEVQELDPATESWDSEDLREIDTLLRGIKQKRPQHAHLVDKLLTALAENNLWSLVNVYVAHLQMTVLGLRVEVAGKIQERHKGSAGSGVITISTIRDVQKPYKAEMESLLFEISSLVPLLLQETPKEQCERMLQRIQCRLEEEPSTSSTKKPDDKLEDLSKVASSV